MGRKRSGQIGRRRSGSRKKRETGIGKYVKAAFHVRWNVLSLFGAVAAAVMSPMTPVLLPLVGVGELLYLAGLVSIPKFRSYVDRKEYEKQGGGQAAQPGAKSPELALHELLSRISGGAQKRFRDLRDRCLEMNSIASGVTGRAKGAPRANELTGPGLDRLLWVFLRLLVSQNALTRFLEATDEDEIQAQIAETRTSLAEAEGRGDERMIRTLRDSLATSELRLDNYGKADQNSEYVSLELDRLERKIQALSEMAVNRQDPDFISREVDSVTASITQTEEAMNELQLVTGMMEDLDATPLILSSDYEEALEHES